MMFFRRKISITERNMLSSSFEYKPYKKIGDLMSDSNSKNLEVSSCTGGISGSRCNHPISSEEPRKVFNRRVAVLRNANNYQLSIQKLFLVKRCESELENLSKIYSKTKINSEEKL